MPPIKDRVQLMGYMVCVRWLTGNEIYQFFLCVVVELGSLSDSGGLKTDAQGGSKVLQTCFTGVLSPGGNYRHSNTLQESKTRAHYIVRVPILPQLPRRKNLQMGNNQSVYIAPREVSLVRRARNASVGGKLKRWNTLGWSVLQ